MRSSDIDLLETFRSCLDIKNKIGQSHNDGYAIKPSYRIQFSNVQLYNWLIRIGVTPVKTYTLGEIKIPNIYFRDFLRGHLDGDGSIFSYIDHYNIYKGVTYTNRRVYTKFISASENHIRWLYNKINQLADLKGALLCKNSPRPNRVPMWEIKFAKKESLKLLQWLYYQPNLPCLKRKNLLAKRLINFITSQKRRPYTRIIN